MTARLTNGTRRIRRAGLLGALALAAFLPGAKTLAQTASASPEPAATIAAAAPLPGPLAQGVVVIPYRAEHLKIVAVFGPGALTVSPRIGHLHVTVDGAPWHWVDASGEPLVLTGLAEGPHRVGLVLANANHQPLDQVEVAFTVPAAPPGRVHQ
jgi:hypothetical protein